MSAHICHNFFINKRESIIAMVGVTLVFTIVLLVPEHAHTRDFSLEKIELPPVSSSKKVLSIVHGDKRKTYSISEIEELGLYRISTSTYWPEDDGVYEGVLLKDLLEDAGIADSKGIKITARDSYSTEIPRIDWQKYPIILATRRMGETMSVRQKGPTRIIYPKDMGGDVASSVMRVRWIWAIDSISPLK